MSQFFESYHLRSADRNEAVTLLKGAGLRGFVFPSGDGWTSFVCDGEPFAVNEALLKANRGYLLQFAYSDDHGWTFVVINGHDIVFAYDSPGLDFPGTSAAEAEDARLPRHFDWLSPDEQKRLWVLLFATSGAEDHLNIAFQFAGLVGITHFKEVSFEAVSAASEAFDDVIEVV